MSQSGSEQSALDVMTSGDPDYQVIALSRLIESPQLLRKIGP